MPWNTLANNQTVSFTNLKDAVTNGYFVALTTIPTSQEQITKSDASTYASIDTSYGPYAAKSSNQLVVKSNLRPISYSYTIYYEEACFYDGFYIEGGAAYATAGCSNTLTITLYSPVSSFANGMKLFYDSACTNLWYGDTGGCGQYYKVIISSASYSFTYANQSSTVGSLTACASYYTYRLYGFGYSNSSDACTNQSFDSYSDVYAAEATLATVSRFYSDTSLITPVVGGSQWYAFTADGTSSPVYRAIVSNGGFLSSSGSC